MSPSPFHLPTLPLSVCEDKDKWDSFGKLEFRAVSALSTLDGMMQASDKADLFWLTWLLKEAQSSNVIEGTVTTFDEILGENVGIVAPIERQDDVREVIRWIYDDKTKVGDVSPIITVNNDIYFVVALKQIHEEGHTPLKEVSSSISYRLANEKRAEKVRNEVADKIAGLTDLNVIADTLGQTVSTKTGITFGFMSGNSTEPAFIGAVAGAEPGVIAGPVAGNIGVYVLQVGNRETGSFYTEDDAKIKAAQIESYQINNLPVIFTERAKIVDNRARFF